MRGTADVVAACRIYGQVMFNNVIVGVDGNDGGRDATTLARSLSTGSLTLVGAHPVAVRAADAGNAEFERERTLRQLEATRFGADVKAELVVVADNAPAHALQRTAKARGADLIVVGSAHHGAIGRALLGDVGRSLVHDAPCPVAVAPKRLRSGRPTSIAVAHDGTPEAQAALDLAAALSAETGAELTVYTVWEDPPMMVAAAATATAYIGQLVDDARTAAQLVLDVALEGLPAPAGGQLLHGSADLQLVRVSGRHQLLVVGSRGWGGARRVALGRTSQYLMHHAECAVLIVPRPPAADRSASEAAAALAAG